MDRRSFFRTTAGGVIGGTLGVVTSSLYNKKTRASEGEENIVRVMRPSEATENMVATFRKSVAELHKGEILFYDDEGAMIEKVSLPTEWDTFGDAQKESWRTLQKEVLGKKHSIEDPLENITASSPHKTLMATGPNETIVSLTTEMASKITRLDQKGRTRLKYVSDFFSDFGGSGSQISKLMSQHIVGLAGAESRFDSGLVSRSGALGIFQLMPVNIINPKLNPKRYSVAEVSSSLIKQAEIAKRLFQMDWLGILAFSRKHDIAGKFFKGDQQKTLECFLFPLLINSYNTGLTNIGKVLDAFIKKYPTKSSLETGEGVIYEDGFGYDLFWLFTRFGLEHKGAPTYGDDSATYFFKTIAMSESLRKVSKKSLPYTPPNEREYRDLSEGESKTYLSQNIIPLVAGGTAGILLANTPWKQLLSSMSSRTHTTTASPELQSSTRRSVLRALSLLGSGSLLKGDTGKRGINPKIEIPLRSFENRARNNLAFTPEKGISDAVKAQLFPKNTNTQHKPIERRHHGKTITPWLDDNEDDLHISPKATRKELKSLSGKLNASFSNTLYRPRELGVMALSEGDVQPVGSRNHPDYLAIHSHTEKLIREISSTLNLELARLYGLDTNRYRVRLVISSGARDKAYAKRYLRTASDQSSHPYGIAFDIAPRFDILDLGAKRSYMIVGKDGPVYSKIKKLLDTIISNMQHKNGRFQGKLFAIQELRPEHIHVTDRLGEEKWKPPILR